MDIEELRIELKKEQHYSKFLKCLIILLGIVSMVLFIRGCYLSNSLEETEEDLKYAKETRSNCYKELETASSIINDMDLHLKGELSEEASKELPARIEDFIDFWKFVTKPRYFCNVLMEPYGYVDREDYEWYKEVYGNKEDAEQE